MSNLNDLVTKTEVVCSSSGMFENKLIELKLSALEIIIISLGISENNPPSVTKSTRLLQAKIKRKLINHCVILTMAVQQKQTNNRKNNFEVLHVAVLKIIFQFIYDVQKST